MSIKREERDNPKYHQHWTKQRLQIRDFAKSNSIKIAKSVADVCTQSHHTHTQKKTQTQTNREWEQMAACSEDVGAEEMAVQAGKASLREPSGI